MPQNDDQLESEKNGDVPSQLSTTVGTVAGETATGDLVRMGKDEMNLVEYPFAALWKGAEAEAVISHEWETQHPVSGRKLQASWRVTGDPQHGLPNPSDERVYLVLMELTRSSAFANQAISFSRYDVLRRLGWSNNDRAYEMLAQAFERLMSVSITARNAFWDPGVKSFRNVGFTILDHYNIVAEKPGRKKKGQNELPVSSFKWSDVMFASFQAGFLKTLDLDFALSLHSPIALRLYRYLDKKAFNGRRTFEIELGVLCDRHLGMRPNPYPSKYKERLAGAHEELIEQGFLESVSYLPMKTKKSEKVCYTFVPRHVAALMEASVEATKEATEPVFHSETAKPAKSDAIIAGMMAPDKANVQTALLHRILDLKVSPDVARDLCERVPAAELQRQLDCLSDRDPRDPAAIFVKAVREGWEVPLKYFERQEAVERAQKSKTHKEESATRKAAQEALMRQQKASSQQESVHLDALWEKLDDESRLRLEKEATARLGILSQSGRAQGALLAMRRNLLRELLDRADDEPS
jgi:hypothetical protein